jgi:hypothetical protein
VGWLASSAVTSEVGASGTGASGAGTFERLAEGRTRLVFDFAVLIGPSPVRLVADFFAVTVASFAFRIGRSYFPATREFAGISVRPPIKPCMPISGTRLTSGLSRICITLSPGI